MLGLLAAIAGACATVTGAVVSAIPVVGPAIASGAATVGAAVGTMTTTLGAPAVVGSIAAGSTTAAVNGAVIHEVGKEVKDNLIGG